MKVAQSCPTPSDPMDHTVHGILQARILEWVAIPFSRGFSQPRGQTQVSRFAGRFFTSWTTREAQLEGKRVAKKLWERQRKKTEVNPGQDVNSGLSQVAEVHLKKVKRRCFSICSDMHKLDVLMDVAKTRQAQKWEGGIGNTTWSW